MASNLLRPPSSALLPFLVIGLILTTGGANGQEYRGQCDKDRNANLPFCDPNISIDARVQDLLGRLTIQEKVGLLINQATGASQNVDLDDYNWWGEALHGVAVAPSTHFRPPTEFATVFPQPISLASSFSKELFSAVATATGNEARAFYNVGNAGLTFWSPSINIYRDPRWGRGHETPGEDPRLTAEYAKVFVHGLQGNNEEQHGFLKASACCKHFAAHSVEEGRFSFDAVVNEQDMADTYLPAFQTCVQEAGASCVMCAYSAINGVPSCAHKEYLTGTIREHWGFDGYIVSDCGAVADVWNQYHYGNNETDIVRVVLDSGVDIECFWPESFFTRHLPDALNEGLVTEQMLDTALARGFRVLMRLAYFEKDETRPFKDLQPGLVDSDIHKDLALVAARQSIVLLKNAPNLKTRRWHASSASLPLDPAALRRVTTRRRASMALIGPHLNASHVLLGNYEGIPSHTHTPWEEIRKYVPDLEGVYGCDWETLECPDQELEVAEELARNSEQVVLFVGISAQHYEAENRDRPDLRLPGRQDELIRRVIGAATQPVILFVVSGGAIDVAEWEDNPGVGAILWAGYLGQAGGRAMADVLFGAYNPSGRLPQTFYHDEYMNQVSKFDMRMRPHDASPGRTYRFFTGQVLYPFGYGLSYTSFQYNFEDVEPLTLAAKSATAAVEDCDLEIGVNVRNSGQRGGDHSVLSYLAPPNAGQGGRPIKSLHDFARLDDLEPNETKQVVVCLNRNDASLANENGDFEVISGEWKLTVGDLEKTILVT